MPTRITRSAEETQRFGAWIGEHIRSRDVILLSGELGSGKTTLVQGIAQGLGIPGPVTSPTFTLINEYTGGRLGLIHMDPYRLRIPDDILNLGFDDYIARDSAIVVEWGERLGALVPSDHLLIRIEVGADNSRRITPTCEGSRWEAVLTEIENERC